METCRMDENIKKEELLEKDLQEATDALISRRDVIRKGSKTAVSFALMALLGLSTISNKPAEAYDCACVWSTCWTCSGCGLSCTGGCWEVCTGCGTECSSGCGAACSVVEDLL